MGILPGFRMLSQVMVWHAGMEMYFGYYGMVWSILSIGFLGFIVWAHHMFSIGMDTDSKCYFAAATIVIGIPTGVKIFSWIGHFCTGAVELTVTVIWGVLFIWLFTVGRVTQRKVLERDLWQLCWQLRKMWPNFFVHQSLQHWMQASKLGRYLTTF